MIIVKLQGGLGNQMFQYAFASVLAKKNKSKLLIDDSFFNDKEKKPGFTPRVFELDIFNNNYQKAKANDIIFFNELSLLNRLKKKFRLKYPKKHIERFSMYNPYLLSIEQDVYLQGYFQSYKYFNGNEAFVRILFSFNYHAIGNVNQEILKSINQTNSISVHVRRGDYVNDKITNSYHGVCSLNYYLEAIKLLSSRCDNPVLFFFSDDIDWVKRAFKDLKQKTIFVNNLDKSWVDMFLMSRCKHNIIANSSFSWWGAWLNSNPLKTVIAPNKWNENKDFSAENLLPKKWIKL